MTWWWSRWPGCWAGPPRRSTRPPSEHRARHEPGAERGSYRGEHRARHEPGAERGSYRGEHRARLDGPALDPAALPLAQATPDAEPLVVLQRVLQALAAHLAADADLLGLAGRTALLREERLGVGLSAQRALLPALLFGKAEDRRQIRVCQERGIGHGVLLRNGSGPDGWELYRLL